MKNYGGIWDPRKNKIKIKINKSIKIITVINIINDVNIPGYVLSVPRVYCYALGDLHIIKLRR